jgi:integrase
MTTPPIKTPPPRVRQRWRARANGWRIWWEPETALRELGFEPVELDPKRLTWSVREAERLSGLVDQRRSGVVKPPAARRGRTIHALIRDFETSPEFSELKPATQRDYRQGFRQIEAKWGDSLVVDFTPPVIYQWYRTLLAQRSVFVAASLKRKLSILLSHAVILGWRADNPALGVKSKTPPRRSRIGTWEELDALTDAARRLGLHSIALAILLAIYQGQRRTDIVQAQRAAFAAKNWLLRRSKRGNAGGFELHPEVLEPVRAMLAIAGERERLLHYEGTLERPCDQPYSDELFGKAWARVRAEAAKTTPSAATLQFRDLRRTFATLARAGGADPREVADALGNKAFSDDELSQVYMPPTYESASKAVNAVKRPKGKA